VTFLGFTFPANHFAELSRMDKHDQAYGDNLLPHDCTNSLVIVPSCLPLKVSLPFRHLIAAPLSRQDESQAENVPLQHQTCFIHCGVSGRRHARPVEIGPGCAIATEWDESPR
jgi:hypothetical protein